jgi:hypothetical protein
MFFRSRDYHSIPRLNGNLASAGKCSGPLRFRLRQVLLYIDTTVRVRVTLRLTVSQSVCLGVEPHLGHMTRNLFIDLIGESYSLVYGGALSDERSGLSFVSQSSVLGLCLYICTVYLQNLLNRVKWSALCTIFTKPLSHRYFSISISNYIKLRTANPSYTCIQYCTKNIFSDPFQPSLRHWVSYFAHKARLSTIQGWAWFAFTSCPTFSTYFTINGNGFPASYRSNKFIQEALHALFSWKNDIAPFHLDRGLLAE